MSQPSVPLLVAVMGTTASGKTELAEELAYKFDAQLINADAFQIYRGMDIGTAKPANRSAYRLIDIRDPNEGFGVGEFVSLATEVLNECWSARRNVIVVGGTGLYIRALLEEYDGMSPPPDPALRELLGLKSHDEIISILRNLDKDVFERTDLKNRVRVQRLIERLMSPKPSVPVRLPPFCKLKLAVVRDPIDTLDRITRRVDAMMHNGWVQEVQNLATKGFSPADPGMRALGYRAIWKTLTGEVELEEAKATTIAETRQYAKRQRTWLRSEPNLISLHADSALDEASQHMLLYF